MKPWFEKESNVIKFPAPKAKVVQMPNVQSYPDFLTGVKDLHTRVARGEISQQSHDKLYQDLIHRFMKEESFDTPWFMRESSGLRSRPLETPYTDEDGTVYKFKGFETFPQKDMVQYPDMETMNAAKTKLEQIAKKKKIEIRWTNQPTNRSKAFGIGKFQSDKGKQVWVGGYFVRTDNAEATIRDGAVTNQAGLSRGTFKSGQSTTSQTLKAQMGPDSLGLNTSKKTSLSQLANSLKSHKNGDMLVSALSDSINARPIMFKGGASLATTINTTFLEVISPVAISKKHPIVTGAINEALNDIFKGESLDGATFIWPVNQNTPLIDSQIVSKSGIVMGVSSKGKRTAKGRGANASIANVYRAMIDASKSSTGKAYIKKYKEATSILETIGKTPATEAPIILGLKYKLITSKEADALRPLVNVPKSKRTPPEMRLQGNKGKPVLPGEAPKQDLMKGPKVLHRLFQMRGYKAGSYFNMIALANLARLVADHINNDPKIDFGEAIRSFLNNSAMVQATSMVQSQGDDLTVKSIQIVYPPNFKNKATITSSPYYGTEIKNKFGFVMPTE